MGPPRGISQVVRWSVLELEHMAQLTLLQARIASSPLLPTLHYFPLFSPFLQAWGCAGSLGCSGGVQEQGGHWQQGVAGLRPHVLHPSALVSASHGSSAADRSYSEPGSMSEHKGLGDSHGRHIGRKAAGREEQVGIFRRFPNPFPPPQYERFQ